MMDDSEYNKSILPGGLRVLSERIPHVRSVSIGVWVLAGTRDERSDQNGISHFIEHMMFKGTRRRKVHEIAQSLESVGGHLNAFTSKEQTCYYAYLLDEHLPLAVDVLADILTDSIFPEDEIAKEKSVVVEEINAIDDTPDDLVHELFYRDIFPGHALGNSTLGTRENVSGFTRQRLFEYVQQHYTRNRTLIVAAGSLHHDDLVALIGDRFESWPANGARELIPPSPAANAGTVRDYSCSQTHICLGTRALRFDDPRKFSLLTMSTLLGGGMSSRLFQTIRERHGLAYSVFSFQDFMQDTGVFGIYLGTDPAKETQAVDLLLDELKTLQQEPVSQEELERTKNQLKGSLMLGLESTASRMSRLANMEIYLGKYFTLDDVLRGIDEVSSETIKQIAEEILVADQLTKTVIRPSSTAESHRH